MRAALLALTLLLGLASGVSRAESAMTQDEWCAAISGRLASVSMAMCEESGLRPTGASSHKGFPILMREVPAVQPPQNGRPVRVLLIGGIHGDELTSVSIVFQWLDLLTAPAAREIHWHIVPLLNPDGLLQRPAQRMNARGVDLNRNFPAPPGEEDARAYWARRTGKDPRRYPGEAPLSEPESRWLADEIARFAPDVVVSVHAPFGILDFDGPRTPPRRFGRLHLSQLGVYPGSLGNYGGILKRIPIITIELPNAGSMPPKSEMQRIWRDMLAWIARHGHGELPAVELRHTSTKALDEH